MPELIGAIDHGTTSTRFAVYDSSGRPVASAQREHRQILPRPGWVEHDPAEIWRRTCEVIGTTLAAADLRGSDLACVGLTNQRETLVVWDRQSGAPLANAPVWQDTRTQEHVGRLDSDGHRELLVERTGLPPSTYFTASKLRWLLDHEPAVAAAVREHRALAGTTDSWLVWNLTGGPDGGRHRTDVTNASRTQLMELRSCQWDPQLLDLFGVPVELLPRISPSGCPDSYGTTHPDGPFGAAVPIVAVLGDQQAAAVGHACFEPGDAKNTYGTGSFLLMNTGGTPYRSHAGLLTTVAYQWAGEPAQYAIEGSVAVTGSAIQWLRDQLGLIRDAAESEELAAQVADTGGVTFVPAFSGLYAPHWRPDARGVIVGLTRHSDRHHLARAALESICLQTADVVAAMESDSGVSLSELRVDGGVTANSLCMQMQADVLGIPVLRAAATETTAMGAACAAALAVGLWSSPEQFREHRRPSARWEPRWTDQERAEARARWRKGLDRARGWIEA